MVDPPHDDAFDELMDRLRSGDETAATAVFGRFVDRLIALAASRFEPWMRDQADVEGVVMSAYKSFFVRNRRGDFDLAGWDELWALLARITLRKCGKRHRSARRAGLRGLSPARTDDRMAWLPDRTPTPDEVATFADTVEQLFRVMKPVDRPIIEHILMGYTAEEVARQVDCSERTVRRVRERAKLRLRRLIGAGGDGEETGR